MFRRSIRSLSTPFHTTIGRLQQNAATAPGIGGILAKLESAHKAQTDAVIANAMQGQGASPAAGSSDVDGLNAFKGISDRIVRSFRFAQVSAAAKPHDFILSKQESENVFSFCLFKDTSSFELAERLLNVPLDQRNFHIVCGRQGVPVDLYADIDLPLACNSENVVISLFQFLDDEFAKLNVKAEHRLLLSSRSETKHSYHSHIRLAGGAAFSDYRQVRDLLRKANASLGVDAADLQVYRTNGMIRLCFCPKFQQPTRVLAPYVPKDPELVRMIKSTEEMPQVAVMEMSLVNRDSNEPGLNLISLKRNRGSGDEYDAKGNKIPAYLSEKFKWARFVECQRAMHRYPSKFCENFDTWVRVGIALHSFGNDSKMFRCWVDWSARCSPKFDPNMCRKKWEQFSRRPDCFNWHRGYVYLTHTINVDNGLPSERFTGFAKKADSRHAKKAKN